MQITYIFMDVPILMQKVPVMFHTECVEAHGE